MHPPVSCETAIGVDAVERTCDMREETSNACVASSTPKQNLLTVDRSPSTGEITFQILCDDYAVDGDLYLATSTFACDGCDEASWTGNFYSGKSFL
jgi:hypothetical protein